MWMTAALWETDPYLLMSTYSNQCKFTLGVLKTDLTFIHMSEIYQPLIYKFTVSTWSASHHVMLWVPLSQPPSWPITLIHLHQDKMTTISQMIYSDAFSWMTSFVFWLKFHWSLFLRVQLTITQHWVREWHNKSQNLKVSRLVLQLSLPNPLKPGVKSIKM